MGTRWLCEKARCLDLECSVTEISNLQIFQIFYFPYLQAS